MAGEQEQSRRLISIALGAEKQSCHRDTKTQRRDRSESIRSANNSCPHIFAFQSQRLCGKSCLFSSLLERGSANYRLHYFVDGWLVARAAFDDKLLEMQI
jgi:hypothetical protein